jgi:hypothetical protein
LCYTCSLACFSSVWFIEVEFVMIHSRRYPCAVSLCSIVSLGVIGISCSEEKDSNNTEQALPLPTAETFKSSGKLKLVARSDMSSKITDLDDLYDDRPEVSEPDQKCLTDRFGSLKVQASGSTLKIQGTMDLFECFRSTLGDSVKVTAGAFKMTVDFETVCEGKDVSSVNGKTLVELGTADDKLCTDVAVATQRSLSAGSLTLALAVEGKTVEIETEFHAGLGTASLTPCTRRRDAAKQQWTQDDGCMDFSKTRNVKQRIDGVADTAEGTDDLRTISYKGLVGTIADNPWFEAGTASIEWNGWTGVVTYAGATTPPKFTLEKDGQKTDHSFPPVSAASPAGASLRKGTIPENALGAARDSVAQLNERVSLVFSSLSRM